MKNWLIKYKEGGSTFYNQEGFATTLQTTTDPSVEKARDCGKDCNNKTKGSIDYMTPGERKQNKKWDKEAENASKKYEDEVAEQKAKEWANYTNTDLDPYDNKYPRKDNTFSDKYNRFITANPNFINEQSTLGLSPQQRYAMLYKMSGRSGSPTFAAPTRLREYMKLPQLDASGTKGTQFTDQQLYDAIQRMGGIDKYADWWRGGWQQIQKYGGSTWINNYKNGGLLKAEDGGKTGPCLDKNGYMIPCEQTSLATPIHVTDPNDPRINEYGDKSMHERQYRNYWNYDKDAFKNKPVVSPSEYSDLTQSFFDNSNFQQSPYEKRIPLNDKNKFTEIRGSKKEYDKSWITKGMWDNNNPGRNNMINDMYSPHPTEIYTLAPQKIEVKKPTTSLQITERTFPKLDVPPIKQGNYKVDYFDPSEEGGVQGGWHTKSFMTSKEADEYMKQRSTDNKMYGPSMTQRVEYKNGGDISIPNLEKDSWITKYDDGGKLKKRNESLEQKIDRSLNNPMYKGSNFSRSIIPGEEVDNARHYMTSALTNRGIQNKFPSWMQKYTPIPKIAGFIGSNALGAGHEASVLYKDVLYSDRSKNKRSILDQLRESGEDMFNNLVGSVAGTIYNTPKKAEEFYYDLFNKNLLPDGIVDPKGRDFYLKKEGQKKGQFAKYDKGGKIGDPNKPYNAKTNPTGYVSLKNNKDWFDNHANWSNTGNAKYDAKVKQQVLTGRFGVDPNTGALIKLPKSEWTNVSDAYKEEASEEWGKKSMQQRFNSKTPASTEMRKREVVKSTQEAYRNPIMYAPAAVAAAPFVAGALPAIAAGVSSGLSAPLTIGSSVFPAITAGNLANLGFGMYSANQFANPNSETRESIRTAYKDPTLGNVTNAVVNTGLNTLGVVTSPGVLQGLKSGYGALKGLPSYTDKLIYPTRVYRAEVPGGNITGYVPSGLSKKVFDKGDFTTKDLKESFEYLRGTEAMGGKRGLVTGQDMNFTEYKVPFWKKNVSFDPDVVALKKMQGTDVNANEYIIPNKTILDKFLYPRRTTTIQAVPQSIKDMETVLPSGFRTRFYDPSSFPMSPTSREFASPAYKYIEDQMNAVTGHRMPITYEFDQTLGRNQNVPILNWEQPQFAPDPGIGKFNEGFSPIKETLYKYNPWKFKPQEGTMMYRGIGEEGMKDALQSGVFRAKQLDYPEGRSLAEKVTTPKQFGRAFFSPSFSTADRYGQGYIAEVPISSAEWTKRYGNKNWSQMASKNIPIDEGKILKKDWLFGYKQVKPKSTLAESNQSIFSRKKTVNPVNPEDELKIVKGNYLTNELPKNYIVDKDIAKSADRQKSWLQSDEYIARRSDSTGESESQIKQDVNNMLKKWEKVKIVPEKTKYGNVKNSAGSYSNSENTIRINPDLEGGREDSLDVLNHEILHALSQFGTTRNYKNYPVTKIGNTLTNALNSKYNKYLSEAPEQQVRALRLLDFMENKYGIPRGQKVSTDNITKLIEDINPGGAYEKEFWNNYHDVGEQLKGMKEADQKYKFIPKNLLSLKNPIKAVNQGNFKKNLVEHLNKAYVVPAGIVGAAALENNEEVSQQKYGGSVKNKKWINKYK